MYIYPSKQVLSKSCTKYSTCRQIWFCEKSQKNNYQNWFRERVQEYNYQNWFREKDQEYNLQNWFREKAQEWEKRHFHQFLKVLKRKVYNRPS